MFLIIGLGNPGAKYKNTYHNVGFLVLDSLAKKLNVKFTKEECDAKIAKGRHNGDEFVLAKPQTFMNLSGQSVKKLVRAYDIDESTQMCVCYDDVDLPVGKTRFRTEGSAGTHNGMRNIVAELNTTGFYRMRIGIKTEEFAQKEVNLIDLVLSNVDYANKLIIQKSADRIADALIMLLDGKDIERIEQFVNSKN